MTVPSRDERNTISDEYRNDANDELVDRLRIENEAMMSPPPINQISLLVAMWTMTFRGGVTTPVPLLRDTKVERKPLSTLRAAVQIG